MAASTASCEAIWLRKLLLNLLKKRMQPTRILFDNQSCIKLSENTAFHDWSKHIDIRCQFIKDYVQQGAVQLKCIPTGKQVADILTKALGKIKFTYFGEKMGMVKKSFQQRNGWSSDSEGAAIRMRQWQRWCHKQQYKGQQRRDEGHQMLQVRADTIGTLLKHFPH